MDYFFSLDFSSSFYKDSTPKIKSARDIFLNYLKYKVSDEEYELVKQFFYEQLWRDVKLFHTLSKYLFPLYADRGTMPSCDDINSSTDKLYTFCPKDLDDHALITTNVKNFKEPNGGIILCK